VRILFLPGYRYPASLGEPIRCGDLRYSFTASRALARKGHEVTVLTRAATGDVLESELDGVRIVRYRSGAGRLFNSSFDVSLRRARLFQRLIESSDVAFVNSPISLELGRRSSTPLVYIASGLEDAVNYGHSVRERINRLAIRLLREPLKRRTWARAAMVNTTAVSERGTLAAWGVPDEKIRSIGPSVELQRFRPAPPDGTDRIRRQLGVGPAMRLVLSVSRFTPAKGLIETVRGFAILHHRNPDTRLAIVGVTHSHDPAYIGRVRQEIERSGLTHVTRVVQDVPDDELPLYYNAADVTTAFSIMYDPLPTVIIESMACGTPVVSTFFESRRQFIEDGHTGFFVAEGDTTAWAAATGRILEDESLRNRVSAAGLQAAATRFDADEVADQLLGLLDGSPR